MIGEAREYLAHLERREHGAGYKGPQTEFTFDPPTAPPDRSEHELAQRLGAVDPEDLSGRDALDLVYELNKLARKFQGDSE